MGVWAHDSWYSLGLYQGLGYEGDAIRVGMAHYNTEDGGRRAPGRAGALAAAA